MSETPIILYRCTGSCKESVKILEEFAGKTIETRPVPDKLHEDVCGEVRKDRTLGGYAQIDDPDKIQQLR